MNRVAQTHNPEYHRTVLIDEVLHYLDPQPGKIYVDATFGGGGHTRAILLKEPTCAVVAVDWDQKALEQNASSLAAEFGSRFATIWGNFAQLPHLLKKHGYGKVDGVLVDFGTSQYQITEREGFSFALDTPLDMRMSPAHFKVTAADIVNNASEEELVYIFKEYGEERAARPIARAIVAARDEWKITTTGELVRVIVSVVRQKPGKIHPATRIFQALRIVVNKELDNIKTFLLHLPQILNSDGRVVTISFHSLEDRLVKNYFKDYEHEFEILTKKVVFPTDEEIALNPSSRSARLRAAKKR
jgi:16S rRNA (cytosine1402-N4)-methyltransferase